MRPISPLLTGAYQESTMARAKRGAGTTTAALRGSRPITPIKTNHIGLRPRYTTAVGRGLKAKKDRGELVIARPGLIQEAAAASRTFGDPLLDTNSRTLRDIAFAQLTVEFSIVIRIGSLGCGVGNLLAARSTV